eukprot:CAMPEP_0194075918 /NCGR_PEP_ID=MMETSP0149-20130528/2802_1 /TAXON_ID=122233 /ORGANISM="Chaetoceros debilis, Strain MM31A-1" /LENGTH=545 /DNA_ID=CAMNT_0038756521 /DNA_START=111 /DNA_END=1748 /DNA_ORIENTATION=+
MNTSNPAASSSETYNVQQYVSFYLTKAGQIIPAVSGSISILSSLLIMYIICRSQRKFSSPYHQIMFFSSFWDIVASISMALTTIPMPQNIIYPFEGNSYGNVSTCEIQGFFYFLGASYLVCCNGVLNIFFVSTIRFGMREATVKKMLFPICFVASALISVPYPIFLLKKNLINPHPYDSWCGAYPLPADCINSMDTSELECTRGDRVSAQISDKLILFGLGLALTNLVISMIMILHTVYINDVEIYKSKAKKNDDSDISMTNPEQDQLYWESLETTRRILIQALLYIAAFFLCWTSPVLSSMGLLSTSGDAFRLIFQPLQGFFSACIFVYSKVENIHATYGTSYREALYLVITNPASAPEILISMSVVHEEEAANQTYGPGERILATMYSKNNHDDFDMERTNEDLRIEIHSDGITRILPRVDFNAGLNLQSNSNEKKHDAKAIIAQRNAMIKGMYDEKAVNAKEFDDRCTKEDSSKTKVSYGRKAEMGKQFEENLVKEQTLQPSGCDNSELGFSSAISSGAMMGGNRSRSSFDISYGVTTTGNS